MRHRPGPALRCTLTALACAAVADTLGAQCPPELEVEVFGSGAGPYDQVGYDVAVQGDTLLVGSFEKATGFAHVFRRNAGGPGAWGEVVRLEPDSPSALPTFFGLAVDLDGSTIVVGAAQAGYHGTVYLFERDRGGPDAWGKVAKLAPLDAFGKARFGYDVAISGDTLLVGAPRDFLNEAGSAFVVERGPAGNGEWTLGRKLLAPVQGDDDGFGISVALDGHVAVVGAFGDSEMGADAGAVYVFERDRGGPDAWGLAAKLFAPGPSAGERFGEYVAVHGGTIAVSSTHVNKGSAQGHGAVFVFRNPPGGPDVWTLEQSLFAKEPSPSAVFGFKVALDGDRLATSDGLAPGPLAGDGAGYVYRRKGSTWKFEQKVFPSTGEPGHRFGGLALCPDAVAGGALLSDLHAPAAGAGYVFVPDEVVNVCTAAPNSAGPGALLHIEGGTSVVGRPELVATGLPPGQPGVWLMGAEGPQLPFGDGYLCLSRAPPGLLRLGPGIPSDAAGRVRRRLLLERLPAAFAVTPGSTWTFQLGYRDPNGPGGTGFNGSDALRVEFCP